MSRPFSKLSTLLLAAALSLAACSDNGPPPVITDFHPSADTIFAGGSTWLYFKATGATSLRIDPGIGDVTGQTAMPAGPEVTTKYTLTATNAAGTVTASTTLSVIPRAAQLLTFTGAPDSVLAGKPVTLKWTAVDALSLVLTATPAPAAPLPVLTNKSTQVDVTPAVSTVYTLTAAGPAGTKQPAPRSVAVVVGQLPVVALNADTASVVRGGAAALSWTSSVAANFTLVSRPHGAATPVTRLALGTPTHSLVRPLADTDYTIEALGPAGTATSNVVSVAVTGAPATTLHYVEPSPGTADVAALKLRGLGENGALATFDLVVLKPITAGALALELPLDGATAGSREGSVRAALDGALAGDVSPGLVANKDALDPGASPPAAIAALPATGPSAGLLLVAVAQKPVCNTLSCTGGVAADRALAPGAVLATVRLRLQPAGGPGPVFTAGALDAAHGARSVVRSGAGGTSLGTIAVGTLSAQ